MTGNTGALVTAEKWVSNPAGPIVRPQRPGSTVILYLHGDRALSGGRGAAHQRAAQLARLSSCVVIRARYRPTFPNCLDDVRAGYDYCRARGPVVVVGDRLGASLAASLLVQLRDEGAKQPECAVLAFALLDFALEAGSLALIANTDRLAGAAEIRTSAAAYADGTSPLDPTLSPLRANLHGLPPLLLLAAGTDPLLDDTLEFAARAARSGVTVDLRIRQDGRGFDADGSRSAADFIQAWTRSAKPGQPS